MGRTVSETAIRLRPCVLWLLCLTLLSAKQAWSAHEDPAVIPAEATPLDLFFSVTFTPAIERMVIDHGQRIWLMSNGNPLAKALTSADSPSRRPQLSHDGRLLAFEMVRNGYRHIAVYDFANASIRQITFGPYDHHAPAWSPGDDRIVMSSNRSGTFDLWQVDLQQLLLTQLTSAVTDESEPAWSWDGRMAWVIRNANESTLVIGTPGTTRTVVMRSRHQLSGPAFRPGGGVLTVTESAAGRSQLQLVLLSTPVTVKALTDKEHVSPGPVHWLDQTTFLYAADGQLRRRILGLHTFNQLPFFLTRSPAANSANGH